MRGVTLKNKFIPESETQIPQDIKEVELCSGGNTSYLREVFEEFFFDEEFDGYAPMEDIDFSYRVSRKYKLIVDP